MLACFMRLCTRNMPGQTKISSFFSSPNSKPTKRSIGSRENFENVSPKKCKTEEDVETLKDASKRPESPLSLSTEEKKRSEDHRLTAKLKLLHSRSQGVVTDVGLSWFKALENEFFKDYFKNLCSFVRTERQRGTVYPPPHQVFTWTKACEIKAVKVVILGQDPYHGPKQAHGLCFSVLPGVRPPPSLENMYKELASDIEGFSKPGHGFLSGWATQGVLLLNACLTVRASQANSHAGKGWENFTDAVIQWLNSHSHGIVFMLWGSYAQKKGACIDKKKHHVLKSVHPSPLSAHRGFFGCKHFSKCNELLKAGGKKEIDWTYLPEHL